MNSYVAYHSVFLHLYFISTGFFLTHFYNHPLKRILIKNSLLLLSNSTKLVDYPFTFTKYCSFRMSYDIKLTNPASTPVETTYDSKGVVHNIFYHISFSYLLTFAFSIFIAAKQSKKYINF